MAKKIQVKLILELRAKGMSRNQIASTRQMSKDSVSNVFHIADEKGISYTDIQDKEDESVYRLFYPDKFAQASIYRNPEYEEIHQELGRVGVTLKLLWEEYKDVCKREHQLAVGYAKFCRDYRRYTYHSKVTHHLEHKPGYTTQVDWAGQKMMYVDVDTGEVIPVYLFVACLPYSQYTYVEPCLDMKQDTWLRCHINMYRFFGGVSICTVCDNLKTGVIAHPKDGDIVLNEAYEALASHYQTVVMPTAVRKPKFKASVEGSVGLVTTTVIARLRNEVFHSFDTLKAHVTACVHDLNRKPFQKRPFSRIEAFQEEKEYLQPLPSIEYEIANWVYKRKVGLNYHVNFKKNLYSCPYQYLGQYADLRVTDQTVEIYIGHQRVATHNRIPDYRTYKYATNEEHMPEQFKHAQWDAERILNWASKIGPSTQLVIECIFNSVSIKEQGYNPSLSVLRLSKKYSNQRLEVASKIALTQIQSPRYRHLNAILTANQDRIHMDQSHQSKPTNAEEGYVRGAHYYGGNKK